MTLHTANFRRFLVSTAALIAVALWLPAGAGAAPVGTAFSYQGQLQQNGGPADGDFDLVFNLYEGPDPVTFPQMATTTLLNVPVDNGVFTVELDFGPGVLGRDELWLEVEVRPAGVGGLVALFPLQKISSSPYALFSLDVDDTVKDGVDWAELSGIPADFADGVDDVGGPGVEEDPTVQENVKDGVDWTELSGIPADFLDGTDATGITSEADPTVPA
ncbi:MAG: hypothetical protein AAFY88_19080, partial [Acidobacteriota bacterium]